MRSIGLSARIIIKKRVEAKTGSALPNFVKYEFDALLECGILANGFLRLRCADHTHEKRVAVFLQTA